MGNRATKPSVIYSILCKENGMVYVGRTQRPIEKRLNEHFYELKIKSKGRLCSRDGLMRWQEDYEKYGESAFVACVLARNVPPENVDKVEDEFIKKFKSNNPKYGYNAKLNVREKCVIEICESVDLFEKQIRRGE